MADPIAPDFSDVVQPIPRGSAPGEISPVLSAEVSYPPTPTVGLTRLIERHAAAHAAAMHAKSELASALERYHVVRPLPPEAIYYRFGDPVPPPPEKVLCPDGRRRPIYVLEDIRELEAADPCCFSSGSAESPQGPGMAWRPDPRGMARKTEILTAYWNWQTECGYWADQVGWTTADAEARRTADEAEQALTALLDSQSLNLGEIATKARWLDSLGMLAEWSVVIAADVIVCDAAETYIGANAQAHELMEKVA